MLLKDEQFRLKVGLAETRDALALLALPLAARPSALKPAFSRSRAAMRRSSGAYGALKGERVKGSDFIGVSSGAQCSIMPSVRASCIGFVRFLSGEGATLGRRYLRSAAHPLGPTDDAAAIFPEFHRAKRNERDTS